MLLELILAPFFWLVKSFVSLIPAFDLPPAFIGSMSVFFNLISGTGYFLPLGTISTILGLFLIFYFVKFSISVVNWLIAKIPTIN